MSSTHSGYYCIPKVLAERPDLKKGQKVLLTILASESTYKRPADHTHQQLADRLGVSRTTAARWLSHLVALGYVHATRFLPPISRFKARCNYTLPAQIWRLFMRGWAMCGPKWRKLSQAIHDYLEQYLPLHLLVGSGLVGTAGTKNGTDPYTNNRRTSYSSFRPVREPQPAPDHSNQLSFAELLHSVDCEPVRRDTERGIRFLAGVLSPRLFREKVTTLA